MTVIPPAPVASRPEESRFLVLRVVIDPATRAVVEWRLSPRVLATALPTPSDRSHA
ncbi:hypothetical protein FHR49_000258 [Xanthomonas campestris]